MCLSLNATDKPGKTGEPTVKDIQRNSVELTWAMPSSDGGAPITSYVIEYCEEGLFKWLPANLSETVLNTRYTVKGLSEADFGSNAPKIADDGTITPK